MAQMINCPYCRRLTDPNLDSCPHCGGYLRKKPSEQARSSGQKQTCPNCKALVQEGDIICVACGTNLLTGQRVSADTRSGSGAGRRFNLVPWAIGGLVLLLIIIGIAVVVYFVSRDPVNRAEELISQGRDLEAEEILVEHVSSNPNDADALYTLGKLQWRTNKLGQAAQTFENVTEVRPDDADAYRLMAVSLAQSGGAATVGRQITALEQVVALEPEDFQAWYLLALVRGVAGDVRGQIQALERAAEINPTASGTQQFLGVGHALSGQYTQARRALQTALARGGATGDITAALGFVHNLAGDSNDAINELSEAANLTSPTQGEVLTQLGILLLGEGRFREAANHLQRAVSLGGASVPGARFYHALALQAQGRMDEAVNEFQTIMDQGRDALAADAAVQAAHIYLSRGEISRARTAVQQARQLNASGAPFHVISGRIHAREQEIDAAETAFKRAVQMDPSFAPAHLERGLLFVQQQQFAEGLRELELYLELRESEGERRESAEIETLVQQLRQTLDIS